MENNFEEYFKKYKSEKFELIVRISWCWDKRSSGFSMIDNYYKAQARFNQAIDVKTGNFIETNVAFNWLEWLTIKKRFGFKYGYKFKAGNIYRILVREYINKKDDKFKKYYIEQVLEYDIKEPLLDPLHKFESKFENDTTELTVLIKKRIYGWATEYKYKLPKVTFIAAIDSKTNELNTSYGQLKWIEKDRISKLKYNFDDMETYRVSVRKHKEISNSYMLLDVLEKVKDDRLEKIKEEYLKPVVINNKLGDFKLVRKYNHFEGQTDYLGEECLVYLDVPEGDVTVDVQLNKLNEIYTNLTNWNNAVKEYASDELLELANDWNQDENEITKEHSF